jgi:hypothetical protein
MKTFLLVLLWFLIASVTDSVLRNLQEHLPQDWKWIHLNSLAFVTTMYFGAYIGRHYSGHWFSFDL